MIDENQLLAGLPHFMDVRQLEKSYLQTLLLYELYARFEKSLVFKGGTALKFFYGLNRFSEDLDFTYNGGYETANLINSIESAIKAIGGIYGVSGLKRRGTKSSLDFEVKIEGPLFRSRHIMQALEINLSMRESLLLEAEKKTIAPVYPDIGTFFVYVMDINEIFYEKIRAVLTRRYVKSRDIYDIAYIMQMYNPSFDVDKINKKLAYYGKKFSPGEFRDRVNSIDEKSWKSEMSNLIKDVPKYSEVKNRVLERL
jgi:hypothetical protein